MATSGLRAIAARLPWPGRPWRARVRLFPKLVAVMVAVTVIPLAASFLVATWLIRDRAVDQAREGLTAFNGALVGDMVRAADTRQTQLEALANTAVLNRRDTPMERTQLHLIEFQRTFGQFEDMTLLDLNGRVIASSNYLYVGDWRHSLVYQEAAGGRSVFSDIQVVPGHPGLFYTAAVPVADSSGQWGVLAALSSMTAFTRIASDAQVGEEGSTFILNAHGRFISHRDPGRVLEGWESGAGPLAQDSAGSLWASASGVESLCVHRDIPLTPKLGEPWKVVTCQAKSAILGAVTSTQGVMAWAVLASLVVAVAAALVLSRRLAAPIQKLARGVRRVQQGELTFRVQVETADEVAELAAAFNAMADSVAGTIAELQQAEGRLELANKDLEARVKARTRELSDANDQLKAEAAERTLAEAALRSTQEKQARLAQEYAALAEVGRIIGSSLDISEVYERFAQVVHRLIPFDRIVILTIDHAAATLTNQYVLGVEVPGRREGDTTPISGSFSEEVLRTSSGVIVQPDAPQDLTEMAAAKAPFYAAGLRSHIGAPLISNDIVIGVMSLSSMKGRAYSAHDLELLKSIGGQVAGAVANATLYAQRREAEAALRDSEERFRRMSEAEAIAIHDKGIILDANEAMSAMFGYDRSELVGMNIIQLAAPESRELVLNNVMSGYEEPYEAFGRRKDGTAFPGEVVGRPVPYGGIMARITVLRDITERKRVAEERERLLREVTASRKRLQALSSQLVQVQEAERRHLARELHDEIGQVLTGLNLTLDMGARLPPDAARDHLDKARNIVAGLLERIREISLDLRPAMLDDLGLLPALLWYFERYTAQTNVRVNLTHKGLQRRFQPEVETAAFRIVQEALTNVARHAEVDEVGVRLNLTPKKLSLHVQDKGKGFDPESILADGGSSGVAGMTERAALLGGRLEVESAPGAGTTLAAEIPLDGTQRKTRKEKEE